MGAIDFGLDARGYDGHMECSVGGCSAPHLARDYCSSHYARYRRTGSVRPDVPIGEDPAARFDRLVDRSGECWIWTGPRVPFGYGRFKVAGVEHKAHRWAWEREHGPILDALQVCHRCDNPPCVRVAHLFLGDVAANMADRDAKGRGSHGERVAWARLTEADVVAIRRRHAAGETQLALAREFGINQGTVSKIVRRTKWRHVGA